MKKIFTIIMSILILFSYSNFVEASNDSNSVYSSKRISSSEIINTEYNKSNGVLHRMFIKTSMLKSGDILSLSFSEFYSMQLLSMYKQNKGEIQKNSYVLVSAVITSKKPLDFYNFDSVGYLVNGVQRSSTLKFTKDPSIGNDTDYSSYNRVICKIASPSEQFYSDIKSSNSLKFVFYITNIGEQTVEVSGVVKKDIQNFLDYDPIPVLSYYDKIAKVN